MVYVIMDLIGSILLIYLGIRSYYDCRLLPIGIYAILFALNLQFTISIDRDE